MIADIRDIENVLSTMLTEKRYQHSIGVKDSSIRLAAIWGADPDKAAIAGLLHDCARCMSDSELLETVRKLNVIVKPIEYTNPVLIHGLVGSYIAKERFGVYEPEILEAIKVHTTGAPTMSLLSRIIYLADYISADRDFPAAAEIRLWAERDLDKALICAARSTLEYLLRREIGIHPDTVELWNTLVTKG